MRWLFSGPAAGAAEGGLGGRTAMEDAFREPTGLAHPLSFFGDALAVEPDTERLPPPQLLLETVDHPSFAAPLPLGTYRLFWNGLVEFEGFGV